MIKHILPVLFCKAKWLQTVSGQTASGRQLTGSDGRRGGNRENRRDDIIATLDRGWKF